MTMAARHAIFAVGVACLVATIAAHGIEFGYSGSNGPDKWGSLSPDCKLCSSGKSQSPINIKKKDLVYDSTLHSLSRSYVDTNATLLNTGFSIRLVFENGAKGAGTVVIDGKNFTLFQLHWHTPSEHTLDGERYPAELHLVHQSSDGSFAVVAILFKYGGSDDILDDLKDKLKELAKEECSEDEETHIAVGEVDTKTLNRNTRKYYRYIGSLTTPPCTENVVWTVLGKVRSISKAQVAALQAPLDAINKNNSRPTQSLNGRTVKLYNDGHKAEGHKA